MLGEKVLGVYAAVGELSPAEQDVPDDHGLRVIEGRQGLEVACVARGHDAASYPEYVHLQVWGPLLTDGNTGIGRPCMPR